jgi:hypothetical protein
LDSSLYYDPRSQVLTIAATISEIAILFSYTARL